MLWMGLAVLIAFVSLNSTALAQDLLLECPDFVASGSMQEAVLSECTPNEVAHLYYSTHGPGGTFIPELNVYLFISNAKLVGTALPGDSGVCIVSRRIPHTWFGKYFWLQAAQYGRTSNIRQVYVNN
ncbi:MAG: hypothetical protein HND57_11525 [Planctomycetes bacterium]|nr:hypothetical protein [Planctomycetota bacterium]